MKCKSGSSPCSIVFRRELPGKTGQSGHGVTLELTAEEPEDVWDQSQKGNVRRTKVMTGRDM